MDVDRTAASYDSHAWIAGFKAAEEQSQQRERRLLIENRSLLLVLLKDNKIDDLNRKLTETMAEARRLTDEYFELAAPSSGEEKG